MQIVATPIGPKFRRRVENHAGTVELEFKVAVPSPLREALAMGTRNAPPSFSRPSQRMTAFFSPIWSKRLFGETEFMPRQVLVRQQTTTEIRMPIFGRLPHMSAVYNLVRPRNLPVELLLGSVRNLQGSVPIV